MVKHSRDWNRSGYLRGLATKLILIYDTQISSYPNCRGHLLVTTTILVVACVLAHPVDVAAESALTHAVFDQKAGTLELVFNEPPMYDSLSIWPNGSISFLEYDIDSEHRNVLTLGAIALEQFHNITCPTLHVDAGSFANSSGASIGDHSVPLWVVPDDGWIPPRPGVDLQCTLTYRIVESPLTPSGNLLDAVHDGLRAWSELNPGLELQHVEAGEANIRVEFVELGASIVGEACTDCLYTFATEQVTQRCSGELGPPNEGAVMRLNHKVSDYSTLRNTVAHEFGHNLGLCHHQSTDNVMGDGASDCQFPYDDLGYDIPKTSPNNPDSTDGFLGDTAGILNCLLLGKLDVWAPLVIIAIVAACLAAHYRRRRDRRMVVGANV